MRRVSSPQRGKMVARKPSASASRSTAATVASVVSPFVNRSLLMTDSRVTSAARATRFPGRDRLEVPLPAGGDVRLDHLRRVDDTIELVFGDETERQRRRLQREIVVHRVMRDPG